MPSTTHTTKETTVVKGPGLARGPALIVGSVLAIFGLMLFFRVTGTPLSTAGFPDAQVEGQKFLGFEANAWTAWLTIAAGVLLLIGAAQHLVAKTMSLIVGLVLGAAAVIALIDGDDVLGLAAANGLTILGWGIAAALLLFNTLAPRIRHEEPRLDAETRADDRYDRDRADERTPVTTRDERQRTHVATPGDERNRTPVADLGDERDRTPVGAHDDQADHKPVADLDWRARQETAATDPRAQSGQSTMTRPNDPTR